MRSQEQAFRVYYAAMSDAELLQIATHRNSYIPTAQRTLADEIEKRHLAPAEPAVSPGRRASLWNRASHLFRFPRRVHHHPASP